MSDLTQRTRNARPNTGDEWRRLGFYQEADPVRHVWHLVGSREGLQQFPRLMRGFADHVERGERKPLKLGPYEDFQLKYWERAGVDDESVHGLPDDFRRLAMTIEERLQGAMPGAEILVGGEYASDLEYELLLEVMSDNYDPAEATDLRPEAFHEAEGVADTSFAKTLPCQLYDADAMLTETEGLARLEGSDLVLEYEVKDAFFGAFRTGAKEARIPLGALVSIKFKRGFFGAEIAVQGRDMKSVADVPTARMGRVRLKFKREHRDDAGMLAAAIEQMIEG